MDRKEYLDKVNRLKIISNMLDTGKITAEQCARMCRNFAASFSSTEDEYYEEVGDEMRMIR